MFIISPYTTTTQLIFGRELISRCMEHYAKAKNQC